MMVAGNREDFKEVVTFKLSLENFRIWKFRDEELRTIKAQ